MHVLLVHDATTSADHAARFLQWLAPRLGARVSVLDIPPRRPWRWRSPRRIAASALDRLARGDVDLVVLGGGRRGPLSRMRPSASLQVLRHSPVPVLVVGDAPVSLRQVVVCTSLEMPHGRAALQPVVDIATATDAQVEVLHVRSQLPRTPGPGEAPGPATTVADRDLGAAEAELLDDVTAVFAAHGVTVRSGIRTGLVVDEIVAEARRLPADLVVLGAHGRPGFTSRLLTNITEQVVTELARPVLVVREPEASGR